MVRLGNRNAGFSLIEVLIATMILSALVYLATLSYSMFLNVWEQKKLTDTKAINDYIENKFKQQRQDTNYIRERLTAVIAINIRKPEF